MLDSQDALESFSANAAASADAMKAAEEAASRAKAAEEEASRVAREAEAEGVRCAVWHTVFVFDGLALALGQHGSCLYVLPLMAVCVGCVSVCVWGGIYGRGAGSSRGDRSAFGRVCACDML